jgi:hypothetical protein
MILANCEPFTGKLLRFEQRQRGLGIRPVGGSVVIVSGD